METRGGEEPTQTTPKARAWVKGLITGKSTPIGSERPTMWEYGTGHTGIGL